MQRADAKRKQHDITILHIFLTVMHISASIPFPLPQGHITTITQGHVTHSIAQAAWTTLIETDVESIVLVLAL